MNKKIILILIVLFSLFLYSCSEKNISTEAEDQSSVISENHVKETLEAESPYTGQIYLYGEEHGVTAIIDKEYELWYDYYHNHEMRHLFIEASYCSAGFLNLWMQAEDDDLLDRLFVEKTNTAASHEDYKNFYKKIKSECPETIFHGTDVAHQYHSTGKRYLEYLEANNQKDSAEYKIAKDVIEQGELFSNSRSSTYRENMMVKNFIRELDALTQESIMGIYGSAHTGLDDFDYSGQVKSMANQLNDLYPNQIVSEDLIYLAKNIEPERVDQIEVNGKMYQASYYGKHSLDTFKEYKYREFWRLEDAYDDFKDFMLKENVLPESNYPMTIEKAQVFVVDYTLTDGSIKRTYLRVDGYVWRNMLTSVEMSLNAMDKMSQALRVDDVQIGDKTYEASYFGQKEFKDFYSYKSIEYWRVEDAYDDLKNIVSDGSSYFVNNLPFEVEIGQVFILDITLPDETVHKWYGRYDGVDKNGMMFLIGFMPE